MFQLTEGCLNVTINGLTRNAEPEIGTDGFSPTRQNPRDDLYGSGFGRPRGTGSGCWSCLELNQPGFTVINQTAGGLPGHVSNTSRS